MFVDLFLIVIYVFYNYRVGFLGNSHDVLSIFLLIELMILVYLFIRRSKKTIFRISFWVLSILTPLVIIFFSFD
ncbi:hypothetical protein A2697_04790 [Candidatus Curtissbacteria bacterium RIFCSPHIGHO2_01_FULL_41_44]|nr:MAG: hypothetical protein A3C33_03895 [Candidatus Curtissbacteria bacterium RIFCSPHIGHO2_02_FULL_42_58]OGD94338.1 MAG: hypothetical protein A2697_04790 [Candidatus Curtissbacteria bacterium RIFCSPHIGHO2_01_FULL_41_44]OGD97240.1 MAG: hypothetical protein A3E71_04230 [Candidatus Curtissbacteria bacterium RIFCSPHIGHO2_12_FULL_42_33]OGE02352.1 MAG: hypothetical protein A3G16_03955 [Candidatus Curtissbacteria bacterium RIFCSPLOWO2_12_FULL_41_16]